jgi:hypothetical protein
LVGPRPHGGGHTPKLDDEKKKEVLGELVAQKPDAFCRELADDLHAATGVRVCRQTIGSWLAELGLTRKKVAPRVRARRAGRQGPARRLARRPRHGMRRGLTRVTFLDESGAVTKLVRAYGRSDCGARCVDAAPQGHWKVMTAVAAVRLAGGLVAPFTIDCPVDGEVFAAYVGRVLAPTLRAGT